MAYKRVKGWTSGRSLPVQVGELRASHLKWFGAFLFAAGRYGEDHTFTEEDWSSLEGSSPYEKSKHLAEKAAWELVKDLPG